MLVGIPVVRTCLPLEEGITHWVGVKRVGSKIARGGEPTHDATVTMYPFWNCPLRGNMILEDWHLATSRAHTSVFEWEGRGFHWTSFLLCVCVCVCVCLCVCVCVCVCVCFQQILQWHRLKHSGEPLLEPKAGLKRGGKPPPPPVSMALFPASHDNSVWRYDPIFPDLKMGRLAWLATHLQIVLLLLAEPITMGGPDAFQSGRVPCQKTLPKAVLMAEKTCRPFCKLGWSADWAAH